MKSSRLLGMAILGLAVLIIVFYVPVKQFVFRLGVPSGATPWPVLGLICVCVLVGARMVRR